METETVTAVPRLLRRAAGITGLALLSACATAPPPPPTFIYTPPPALESIDNVRTLEASFDETWKALINYVSGTFFGIRNFEKASGLLTLSFGSTDIPRFVECGTWQVGGPAIRYIERADFTFVLDGQMNLLVESVSPGRTRVRVTTRYVLRDGRGTVYEFTSNTGATVPVIGAAPGTSPMRTCRSTHAAEKQILTGVGAISSR